MHRRKARKGRTANRAVMSVETLPAFVASLPPPVLATPRTPGVESKVDHGDDPLSDDCIDDEGILSGEDDSEGSLVDFIADDDDSEASDANEGEGVDEEVDLPPLTKEEDRHLSLDGIDVSNILPEGGKRKRRVPAFYEAEVFASKEVKRMMFEDVPEEEMDALAASDSDEGEDEGETDDEYVEDSVDESESEGDADEGDANYHDDAGGESKAKDGLAKTAAAKEIDVGDEAK